MERKEERKKKYNLATPETNWTEDYDFCFITSRERCRQLRVLVSFVGFKHNVTNDGGGGEGGGSAFCKTCQKLDKVPSPYKVEK